MRKVIAITLVLAGCAGEHEPPWTELSLRDVLGAEPATLEALPHAERVDIAERFETERRHADETMRLLPVGHVEADVAVAIADEERALDGEDALVATVVHAGALALEIETVPASFAGADAGVAAPASDEVVWEPAPEGTLAIAANGRAGAVVAEVGATTGARLARVVPRLHTALASDGDVVLVSASWLTVMAALEPEGAVATPPSTVSSGAVGVTSAPLLSGSPYSLASLAECTADITGVCAACLTGRSCVGYPTLRDFGTVEAECLYLAEDSSRAEAICAMGMLSVSSVSSCVRRIASGCPTVSLDRTSSSVASASAFLAVASCRDALDRCASDRTPPQDCDASCDPDCGLSCSDTFSGCSACADTTTSTTDSCSSSCDSLGDCGDRCDRCEVGGSRRSSPFGSVAVAVPVLVALVMARRRVRR